ncbi:MAG: response regulator [Deltaproteobacteria bacterium]|nr:MAG: response regulator [Deltaproteobacteria bacterium]
MIDPADILRAKVLIVDDQEANVLLLERMLSGAGYVSVVSTRDPRAVCELHRKNRYDLILLDLQMPIMDGFQVMEALAEIENDGYLPVLVVTAQPDHKLRALRAGARDFVSKPFDLAEVLMRVRNMLEVRLYAGALEKTVHELEISREVIRGKNDELKKLFDQVVAERKVSERLALQAPPGSVAERLQARADATEDGFPDATVLIADIVGFAKMTPAVPPGGLALILDEIFTVFDGLATSRGMKKIKMLGNSYMAASGIPMQVLDHAAQAADVSLDMIDALDRFNERTASVLQVRIGIATGGVVASVVGRRLFVHDLWGEAVSGWGSRF